MRETAPRASNIFASRQPYGVHPVRQAAAGGGGTVTTADIIAMFAGVSLGWLWEPGAVGGSFQNSDGTGALTADGDPVGYVTDLSGNGFHALQATTAYKGVLHTDDDVWSVETNYGGAAKKFLTASLGSHTLDENFTYVSVFRSGTDVGGPMIVSGGAGYIDWLCHYPIETRQSARLQFTGITNFDIDPSLAYGTIQRILWSVGKSGESGNEFTRINGIESTHNRGSFSAPIASGSIVGMGLDAGGVSGQVAHVAFDMFIARVLTTEERATLFSYLSKFDGWV